MVRSLWNIKCIIQEAFLPCQPEPSWQTFSLLRKREEASWFHREYLCCPLLMSLGEEDMFWEMGFFYYKTERMTLVFPRERKVTEPLGAA